LFSEIAGIDEIIINENEGENSVTNNVDIQKQ